jgi:hypothetical protein
MGLPAGRLLLQSDWLDLDLSARASGFEIVCANQNDRSAHPKHVSWKHEMFLGKPERFPQAHKRQFHSSIAFT